VFKDIALPDARRAVQSKEVSALLSLSIKTTETHRATAMRKLNVRSTAGLVRYAVRNKLLEA